jgi:hypothetical protein
MAETSSFAFTTALARVITRHIEMRLSPCTS